MIRLERLEAMWEALCADTIGLHPEKNVLKVCKNKLRWIELYNKNYIDLKNWKYIIKQCCDNCNNYYNGDCIIRNIRIDYRERCVLYCKGYLLNIKMFASIFADGDVDEENKINMKIEEDNVIKKYGEIERHEE